MIKSNVSISQVKDAIAKLYNESVDVTVNLGRNKKVSFVGKLTGIYSALFTVSPLDGSYKGKTSYSYSEYMCGRVKIKKSAE